MRRMKVCLIGEARVGKTSLAHRYVLNVFDDRYRTTLGAHVMKHKIRVKHPATGAEEDVTLVLWDIMGEATLRDLLRDAYFSGASALLAVCDVTRPDSVSALGEWVASARGVIGPVPTILVANKIDLAAAVPRESLDGLSASLEAPLLFTSAKTGEGVARAFEVIAERALAASA